ncbi:MAG: LysR family transcriptional regulator [Boseongicola sp.]|nr:MAG: LysR family transcriptional regulator [Boseongicola sp.]
MLQLPPLNGLRAFEAAGRHLNFRAAAEELGVTQGAVAQQVRGLEAVLGLRLFDRHARGLSFTGEGRGYHAAVADAFQGLSAATAALKPGSEAVTISVTPTFAAKWLLPHLPELSNKAPEIDLRVMATEGVMSFRADGIDLAVRQGQPPFGASLEAHLLFRNRIVAVAAPGLLDGLGGGGLVGALEKVPLVHDVHDLWPAFYRSVLRHEAPARRAGPRFSQTSLAMDAALAGQGVALVPQFLARRDIDEGRLVQVTEEALEGPGDFYLLAQRPVRDGGAIAKVLGWMTAAAEVE